MPAISRVQRRAPADPAAPRALVVLIHGLGADGTDLIDLADAWSAAAPGAVFLAPDAPHPYEGAPFGRQWFPLTDRRPAVLAAAARAAAPELDAWLDAALVQEGVPPGRLVLMGFSQGAMLSLQAGLRRRPAPAAILAFAGALLDPDGLAAGAARSAEDAWPPVLLVHGIEDSIVPAEASRRAETVLRGLGVPVETRFVPGVDHGIDPVGIAAGAAAIRRALTA